MAAKRIFIYATFNDLVEVLTCIDKDLNVKYYKSGLLNFEEIKEYNSLISCNEIFKAKFGESIMCDSFIIVDKNSEVGIREVAQYKNGIKYAIDQKINPFSVVLRPGGIFDEARGVIEGEISTMHLNDISIDLFGRVASCFKKKLKKKGRYYIGEEAFKLYQDGWRLTQSIKLAADYDFKI